MEEDFEFNNPLNAGSDGEGEEEKPGGKSVNFQQDVITPPITSKDLSHRRKSSLKKQNSSSDSDGKKGKGGIRWDEEVTVRELPEEEADDAITTRKGDYRPAPEHDELWDGDVKDFWADGEKTIEEVRRIVVIRQMRMALQYNLGYAFYAMVANFKKRRPKVEEKDKKKLSGATTEEDDEGFDDELQEEDIVPEFDTPEAEELAIRKEIRELFTDSVKGLEFADLVQDREAFERIYSQSVVTYGSGVSGLKKVEALIDEIMNVEAICYLTGVQFIEPDTKLSVDELKHQSEVEEKVQEEMKKSQRRRSVEIRESEGAMLRMNSERRASLTEHRRASIEKNTSLSAALEAPALLNFHNANNNNVDREEQPIFASSSNRVTLPPAKNNNASGNGGVAARPNENAISNGEVITSPGIGNKNAPSSPIWVFIGLFLMLFRTVLLAMLNAKPVEEVRETYRIGGAKAIILPLLVFAAIHVYQAKKR